jgi:CHASE2 domain-containing sensor protein/tRNA A-37 threonylcarbamoyl transferase component Bud32
MSFVKKINAHVLIVFFSLLITLPLSQLGSSFFVERWLHDFSMGFFSGTANKKIHIIAIDEKSIAEIGRWPWSRDYHSAMIDRLNDGGAKVIAYPIFFLEAQKDRRLDLIDSLLSMPNLHQVRSTAEEIENPDQQSLIINDIDTLFGELLSIRGKLDIDDLLAREIERAKNVVLPYHIGLGRQLGLADEPLPDDIKKFVIDTAFDTSDFAYSASPIAATHIFPPIKKIATSANALGHLAVLSDSDGIIRSTPLFLDYYGELLPSFTLQVAAKALNLPPTDIKLNQHKRVELANLRIATDHYYRINNVYYGSSGGLSPFEIDSFSDVLLGNIAASKYLNKVVLIGVTASGITDLHATPIHSAMAPIISMAHNLSNILNEEYVVTPAWSNTLLYGLFAVIFLYLLFINKQLKANISALVSFALLFIIIVTEVYSLAVYQYWLPLVPAAVFLVVGHLFITTNQYLQAERAKESSDKESAEGNRMLGLSYQGQGQLDAALEKFKKCPLDDSMMPVLYNLALDFERKRQFSKATVIYIHMSEYDKNYKDIGERKNKALQLENTIIMGAGSGTLGPGQSITITEGDVANPMLGRYEITAELGKGAMGIVYKGRDPKIDRIVAIKTMALSQEFEADEIESVKERFFREAETAGKLNHSNIVTVFDAGDEHDLAYIAMEFLPGGDLSPFTKKDNLLPLPEAFDILIDVCRGLAYAHEHNVVHRDIKPANIMYNRANKKVVITDFGIARVTDSSKTKTGTVLGTPSYMSPEQFQGKKSDGRADIFALGVMAFQLTTGKLPFGGDSLAGLMYSITSEPYPDPLALCPELPDLFNEVLHNALAKDRDERYLNASMMADELLECRKMLEENNG